MPDDIANAANQRAIDEAAKYAASNQASGVMGLPIPKQAGIDHMNQRLRQQCLEIAVGHAHSLADDPITNAQKFYDFITGKDSRNIRTTVLDALNEAGVD